MCLGYMIERERESRGKKSGSNPALATRLHTQLGNWVCEDFSSFFFLLGVRAYSS